jgi:hypothetical protein
MQTAANVRSEPLVSNLPSLSLPAQTGHSLADTMLRCSPSERLFVDHAAFCWMKGRSADKMPFVVAILMSVFSILRAPKEETNTLFDPPNQSEKIEFYDGNTYQDFARHEI